ncbi:MAG: S41 family peptidase [Bacteroidota bacterium]
MKKLSTITLPLLFTIFLTCAQEKTNSNLNLDFETISENAPANWNNFGAADYDIKVDSLNVQHGKYAMSIESLNEKSDFKALAFNLPENYDGQSITLSGYIKTENINEGYAGLWMRIDPQIAFDNMNNRGITGTTDWQKYQVTLQLNPQNTERIVIGGLLVGTGKMWLDNLKVTIDAKTLDDENLKVYERELLPADKDNEFDAGSTISFPNLNDEVVYNLDVLGKIWGFTKYHHPEIAKGNYNWDYELFRMLPDYLAAKTNKQRDGVLTTWIAKFGEIEECTSCKSTPDDAILKPNLTWIENSNLSAGLKEKLMNIYNNRNQGDNYYIALKPGVGNPDFTNERQYETMAYPDAGFRLLALYRYWNMIAYFFPNKHLIDKDWNSVLSEYIKPYLEAKNELEYELASVKLIGEISDTHANLWGGRNKINELRGSNFAPFRAEFVEGKYVVTDYYNPELTEEAKLNIGDVITHINGKKIETIIDSLKPYYPVSNKASRLRDMAPDLLRSSEDFLALKYVSNQGESKTYKLKLYDRKELNMYRWFKVDKDSKCYKILDGNIGYITLANIKQEDIPVIKETFKNTKAIIIDIRNYPTTFVPFALGSYFLDEPTAFVKFSSANINNPGEFTYTDELKIPNEGEGYKGQLMVLVNENSQSQAEYTAMAFRSVPGAKIIGSATAGADGNVSNIFLPGGMRTMISGIGVYYPDGTETQRIGIVPDITIQPTIQGIIEGKDEVLDKAIEVINQNSIKKEKRIKD